MSNDIEKKIVEIEFENRNFEKSIKRSQKSIQELNKSLEFKGSEKGIQNVEKALNDMRLEDLSNSVKTISERFSNLGVVSVAALTRITNAAITTGKNLVKSLTITPIMTGLQEYETQMNAVQTILANTKSKGTTLDDVNAALDELNHYADETIYNFTEMTKNIGLFTAAGVDLDTSVGAIQGIANLAAVSGSSAQQATNAMYQLSQALSAGRVSLLDWRSVETANMGGELFRNELIKVSEALGTGAEAAIAAQGNFRESLRTGWLTSEVLTETLKRFTTSGANEMVAEYTGLTKESIEETLKAAEAQYGEANAIEEASKQLAEKSGKNQQEIKDVLELAKTAEDAATKVKTFTQLMDTLKEAVQSGWSETWRTVIGDFEEAKELFTNIKDAIEPVILRSSELRNNMLKVWKSLGGRTKLLEGLANVSNSILDIWGSIYQAFYDVFGIVGKELYAMTESFANFTKELVVTAQTSEDIKRIVRGLASILDIVIQVISAVAKAVLQVFVYLKPLLSSVVHFLAVLGDAITIINYILKQTQIFNRLGMATARTLLLLGQIVQNLLRLIAAGGIIIFENIKKIGSLISKAFNAILERFPDLGKMLDSLSPLFSDFVENMKDFVESIKKSFSGIEGPADIFVQVFDSIKKAISDTINFLSNAAKTVGQFISSLFGGLSLDRVKNAIVVITLLTVIFSVLLRLINGVSGLFTTISDAVSESIERISKSISNYLDAKAMEARSKSLLNLGKAVALLAASLVVLTFVDQQALRDSAVTLGIFTGVLMLLTAGLDVLFGFFSTKGIAAANGMGNFAGTLLGIAVSMLLVIKAVTNLQAEMNKTRAYGEAGPIEALWALVGAFSVLSVLATVMAVVTSKWSPSSLKVAVSYTLQLRAVVAALKDLSDPSLDLDKGVDGLWAVGLFLVAFLGIEAIASKVSAGNSSWKNMLASAIALRMILSTMMKINDIPTEILMRSLAKSLGVIIAFRLVIGAASKAGGNDAAKTIQAISLAFLGLVVAMKILSKMDAAAMARGAGGVTLMMVPLGVLMLISNIPHKKIETSAKTILAISAAITIMALCASLLSLLDPMGLLRGTVAISIMTAIVGGVIALSKFVNKTRRGIQSLVVMTVMIGILSLSAGLLATLDIGGLIAAFSGIAIVLGMMTLVFLTAKRMDLKGVWTLTAMAVPIAALAVVLGVMSALDVNPSIETAAGLAILITSLSLCMFLLSKLSPEGILMGMLGLVGVGVTLLLLFEIFALAFAIMEGNGKAIVNGAQLMGECIGALVGGLIGGINAGITATLPLIGSALSEFMTNVQGFINGSSGVSDLDFGALFALTGLIATMSITALLAVSLPILAWGLQTLGTGLQNFMVATEDVDPIRLAAISQILLGIGNLALGMSGFQSENLKSFGEGLPTLATNIVKFCNALLGEDGGASLSVETAQKGADIFAAFAKVAATVPRSGGLIGAVLGNADLGAFVAAMGQAGPAIKSFHNEVTGLESKNVEEGLKILEETIKVASTVPNSGGLLGAVVGENNLDAFAAMMVSAGPDIKTFTEGIKGTKYKDAEQGLRVLKETILAAQSIPNSGESLVSAFVGDNTLSDFASQMASAGEDIKTFIEAMPKDANPNDTIDVYKDATKAVQLLGQLIDVASSIDMQSGWEEFWSGNDSLTAFGTDLATFAPSFKTFWDQMAGITLSGDEMSKKSDAMVKFLDHLAQFADLGDVSLPDLSNLNGQNTVYSMAEGMLTSANSDSTKAKIDEAGDKIVNLLGGSIDSESIKWSANNIVTTMSNGIADSVFNNASFYVTIGEDILGYIELGFMGKPMDELVATLNDGIVNGVKHSLGIESPSKEFQEIGRYIIEGLDLGLQNGNSELQTTTSRMASTIENQFRDDMGIHSPSTLFTQLGTFIVDGLKNGISSGGSMQDILSGLLGDMDFGSMFGDYGSDMKDIFSGAFDNIDLGNFTMEGLDDGSFVDGLMTKIQDQMDEQGLTADVTAVFDADAMQSQLDGMTGTLSTTGTGSVASTTMNSFVNTKFDDGQTTGSGEKNTFQFVQNNYSPKELDRIAIYRQTRNQFAAMKEVITKR